MAGAGKPKLCVRCKAAPQWAGGLCRPCATSFGTWRGPRRTVALLLASLAFGAAAVASADESACSGPADECQEISDEEYGRWALCTMADPASDLCEIEETMPAELEAATEAARAQLAADDDHGTVRL